MNTPRRTPHFLLIALFSALALTAACSGGTSGGTSAQPTSKPSPEQAGQPAPGKLLLLSADRTREVQTFRGTFDMDMSSSGFSFSASGDYQFEAPNKMSMTMDMLGQRIHLLMLLPDMYIEVPGHGWFTIPAESVGINREAFARYVEQRGPIDYQSMTKGLSGLQQLPDEVLTGTVYLRYHGTLDLQHAADDLPAGIIDPSVLNKVKGALQSMKVDLWLDKQTYLPHRMDMNWDMAATGDTPSLLMRMSMFFSNYNEPVDISPPPVDARPFNQLSR